VVNSLKSKSVDIKEKRALIKSLIDFYQLNLGAEKLAFAQTQVGRQLYAKRCTLKTADAEADGERPATAPTSSTNLPQELDFNFDFSTMDNDTIGELTESDVQRIKWKEFDAVANIHEVFTVGRTLQAASDRIPSFEQSAPPLTSTYRPPGPHDLTEVAAGRCESEKIPSVDSGSGSDAYEASRSNTIPCLATPNLMRPMKVLRCEHWHSRSTGRTLVARTYQNLGNWFATTDGNRHPGC
jgi:hypothetical protein